MILNEERARNLQLVQQLEELKRANMLLTEAKNQSESLLEEAKVSFMLKEQEVSELRSQIPAPSMDLDLSASTPGHMNDPDMPSGSSKPDGDDTSITVLENRATQQQQTPQPTADEIAQLVREQEHAQREKDWFEQQVQDLMRQCNQALKEKAERESEIVELRNKAKGHQRTPRNPPVTTLSPPSENTQEDEDTDMDQSNNGVPASSAQTTQNSFLTATPCSSKRKNQMPKLGSVAHRQQLKKNGLDALSNDDERAWRGLMRQCFRSATGQDGINAYQHYAPIEDVIANAFEDGTGLGPNGDAAYTLYFGAKYSRSRWNKAVINNILQCVPIERSELHSQLCDLDVNVQSAMLWDYIRQAQVS
ncbi:hypothetical protein C8R42DRAFT_706032 [Lentinula raphanica]|nr:hypothetical protein C8R42DRAFT_706032 [Lentinula raphanica]